VTVFSAFHEPLDTLARRLDEAGVPYEILDGRTNCAARGVASLDFQAGRPTAKPVMLAGANAMAEGNNWFRCSHAILIAYDWAYNIFEQAINRIHRLNSPKDVTVWPIICKGTIDRRLESLIDEKGDAAELVLDGALLEEATEEVSLRELLKCAYREFLATDTVDEAELEKEWPLLRSRLSDAWAKSQFMGRLNGNPARASIESA
jgi:non-specific serine/threonine protein kinase